MAAVSRLQPQRPQTSKPPKDNNALCYGGFILYVATAIALTVLGGLALGGVLSGTALGASAIGLGALGIATVIIQRQAVVDPAKAIYVAFAIIPLACAVLGTLYLTQTIGMTALGGVMVVGIASPFLGIGVGALATKLKERQERTNLI